MSFTRQHRHQKLNEADHQTSIKQILIEIDDSVSSKTPAGEFSST